MNANKFIILTAYNIMIVMNMPENVTDFTDYFIKVYTWRDGNGVVPVCEAVTLSAAGDVTYSE